MNDSQRRAMFARLRKLCGNNRKVCQHRLALGEFRKYGTHGYEASPIIVKGTLANLNRYKRLGYTTLWSGEGKMAFVRPQPSCRKLKALIKDEKMASKEYAGYGYKRLSHDEARHRKFLLKKYNVCNSDIKK